MKEMSFMKEIRLTREKIALLLIIVFSAVMNLANLSIQGYGNEYYAAGVKSMTMSWSNFFFVAFDPAGYVTIDKPPLGFWIQALSAKLFGYSGWSILLPQALAGVLSVYVLYCVVRKTFGSTAALISAFCLATTPIFVAVSKNNTLDSMLVLTLLLACLVLTKAIETGKLKYLILSLAIVGIGFNVKMLQAYMVLPAFYLTYLLTATIPVKKRLLQLVAGTLVLAVVSLSWAVVVDLVPATNRPYVGSSTNNSELELIFGHNGLERLTGSSGGGMGMQQGGGQGQAPENMPAGDPQLPSQDGQDFAEGVDAPTMGDGEMTMAAGYAPSGDGSAGMNSGDQDDERGGGSKGNNNSTFGGSEPASILRLFSNNGLTDQISWLLPLALIGLFGAFLNQKSKTAFDPKIKQGLLLWTLWLIPVFIYFSFTTGLFHPYYLIMLAAPIAALTGIGMVSLGELYQQEGWKSWLFPIGLVVSGLVQLLMLSYYYRTSAITQYLMIITAVLWGGAALGLVFLKATKSANSAPDKKQKWQVILAGVAFLGLVITPTVWAGTTLFYKMSGTFPSAGLELANSDSKGMGGAEMSDTDDTAALVTYLKANSTNEKYLLAVPSATGYAAKIIIEYGEPVMAIGGFSGSDNILTLDEFKTMVVNGEIRYAMISGGGGGGGRNEISTWIKENGQAISASEWSGTTTSTTTTQSADNGMMGGGSEQLYDLQQE